MRRLHGWLTIIWFLGAIPIMLFWSENIAFLVFISVYAVVTGHWSSFQAARVEVRQEEIAAGQGAEPAPTRVRPPDTQRLAEGGRDHA